MPKNRLRVYKQKISQVAVPEPKNILYVIISLANENLVFLLRTVYFRALEPLHGRFLFIHAQVFLSEAVFFYAATITKRTSYVYQDKYQGFPT